MLTPLDIQKQEFGVKMRGYNADEVDDFLDRVNNRLCPALHTAFIGG